LFGLERSVAPTRRRWNTFGVFLCLLSLEWSLAAAVSEKQLLEEADAVAGFARSAAPQYAADILLRLAEPSRYPARKRIEFAEESFRLASSVNVGLWPVRFRGPTDSVEARRGNYYFHNIDRLSLQLRAVMVLLRDSPASGRGLFSEVTLGAASPIRCDAILTPDFREYYRIWPLVLSSFSASMREKGDDEVYLLRFFAPLTSPLQIGPALEFLAQLPAELSSSLGIRVASQLASIPARPREFESAATDLFKAVDQLAISRSPAWLFPSMQEMLRRQLKGPYCAVSAASGERWAAEILRTWNEIASGLDPAFVPWRTADFPRTMRETSFVHDRFWSTSQASRLERDVGRLLYGKETDKESEAWRRSADTIARRIIDWKGREEASPAEFYGQKALLLRMLVDSPLSNVPLTTRASQDERRRYGQTHAEYPLRATILDEFVAFIFLSTAIRGSDEDLWAWPVLSLVADLPGQSLIDALKAVRDPLADAYVAWLQVVVSSGTKN
jgi:hypothetical protein